MKYWDIFYSEFSMYSTVCLYVYLVVASSVKSLVKIEPAPLLNQLNKLIRSLKFQAHGSERSSV